MLLIVIKNLEVKKKNKKNLRRVENLGNIKPTIWRLLWLTILLRKCMKLHKFKKITWQKKGKGP